MGPEFSRILTMTESETAEDDEPYTILRQHRVRAQAGFSKCICGALNGGMQ